MLTTEKRVLVFPAPAVILFVKYCDLAEERASL